MVEILILKIRKRRERRYGRNGEGRLVVTVKYGFKNTHRCIRKSSEILRAIENV